MNDSRSPWTSSRGPVSAVKRNEASDLHNRRTQLGVNQGRTAEDLLDRYWRGEQRLTTIAHQCQVKSEQSDRVADAVNHLRDRLTEIAKSGNEEIDQIISGSGSTESKVGAVNAVIATKNATAANAAGIAMSNLVDATQRVLDVTIGGDARTWLRKHGVNLDGPAPSRPITAEDLQSPSTAPSAAPFSGGQLAPATPAGEEASKALPEIAPFNGAQIGPVAPPASDSSPKTPARTAPFAGAQMAPAVPPTNTITPTPPPGVPATSGPSVPGVS
ncbi:hypothetical protein [Mycobacterium kansasii]|uniref:hypothetical protein n=1 Tax=Mycobacterium kansasii TaxID=1768 RepID=UPI000B14D2C0|nr:hypothetical protein [Mycobacterium kansasii]GFP48189.1 hypothetical protein MKANGN_20670 [Mycobacterium kansasii]VAZ67380.1 hypothetical protein LAUMK40_03519 [Mycobacterium kansasii]VAZ76649.1 hypothetical protein LAUMK7_03479 [Mycobacterium kansasii]